MPTENMSLVDRLAKKNIKDTVVLGLVKVLTVAIIIFVEDKSLMTILTVITLLFYFVQYQFSRDHLLKSIDKLVDSDLKEFQKTTDKILNLSEKQKLLTNKYTEMLNKVIDSTKSFKTNAIQTKEKTQNISVKIQETYEFSGRESKALNNNIQIMQNLKNKVQLIAELIIELTDYIKQIGSTVNIVENISEQTNMLALNAAVEAARAGEYGKGFAVVAGEIRKLADESKQATNKITSLVSEIEQTTSSTIMATEEGAKDIESGVKFVNEIDANIASLANNIKDLGIDLSDVLTSSIEQQSISNDVIDMIESMQKSINETIETLEENIENIRAFSRISVNIKDISD